ncbi:unnamed protein product [Miscanthus lutarioriparius]|uniref:Alpha/beta hydrolase fold-3 domain-containing protein n=1 Tax=Miscanthus lutarioriparius TaxID=422564 RepID=A0A811SGP5_9POAL|nr:unnamed protein product [Miscanthus lutarioriparius]
MATRMRSCVRCLVNLVLPFLFFASLLYLSTRQPLLDVAVRQEVAPGRLRVFVDRAAKNASVTTVAAAQVSDIAAVATEGADGNVLTDAPPASGDANVKASAIAAIATEDGEAKVVTDAPPASAAAEPKGSGSDIAATASTAVSNTNGDADTIVFDFRAYVFVYKSGRVHLFHATETVPPGVDALTGVASTDVAGASGVGTRLYLPPKNRREGRRGKKKTKKKLPVGVVAVSVDYHLAPEHPLPAAYHDAWAALRWLASNCISGPDALLADHGDATRIFLAGDSAGGNIAHNLAVRAGAEPPLPGGAAIAGVVLLTPYFWGKDPVGTKPAEQWVRNGLEQTWALVYPLEALGA